MCGVPKTQRGKYGNDYVSRSNMDEVDDGGVKEVDQANQAHDQPPPPLARIGH